MDYLLIGLLVILCANIRLSESAGQVGEWNEWSSCSVTCGGGHKSRTRSCDEVNTCSVDLYESSVCGYNVCPEDGEFTEWSHWGMCTLSCGGGTRMRERTCEGPFNGGEDCDGDYQEQEECNTDSCPIDGNWGDWSPWASCTFTCGGGNEIRTRECNNPAPENNGRSCIGDAVDSVICNTQSCPGSDVVDGQWSAWTLFTSCSETCGDGVQTRQKSCTNPPPSGGGEDCEGDATEEIHCNLVQCPIDGNWNWWSDWSSCSTSCYDGIIMGYQNRYRLCDNPTAQYGGNECVGGYNGNTEEDSDVRECNTDACPRIDGEWGAWSDDTLCSKTCGSGFKIRSRRCDNPSPQNGGRICPGGDEFDANVETRYVSCNENPCPIHGVWASWSNFTDCTQTCGDGVHIRTRTCSDPEPAFGGQYCAGSDTDTMPCDGLEECDVDGNWGEWTELGVCTVTCGGGTRERTRQCDSPSNSGNGLPCVGIDTEIFSCGNDTCPAIDGEWSSWYQWSQCTEECDGGIQTRIRLCDNPAPSHGGLSCPGYSTQAESCNVEACPEEDVVIDGGWTSWTQWSECSVTCNGGVILRSRTCTNPVPSPTGRACDNTGFISRELQMVTCNTDTCPVNGEWSDWSTWAQCSRSCNGGLMSRSRSCDNPEPSGGGLNCNGAVEFSDEETQTVRCNEMDCSSITTLTPPPTTVTQQAVTVATTQGVIYCLREEGWEGNFWSTVVVGFRATMVCPDGASGFATRLCGSNGVWAQPDTRSCVSNTVEDLQDTASNAQNNATAREEVLQSFQSTCHYDSIDLAGDLLSCKQILHSLVVMDFLGDVRATNAEKTDYLLKVLQGLDGMLDVSTRNLWQNIVDDEQNDEGNAIYELTHDVENLGHQVAKWLSEDGTASFCQDYSNYEFCIERLYCDTSSYRQPKEPVAATPPPYHTRGGWTAPPTPNVSYVQIPDSVTRPTECGTSSAEIPMKYAVTIVFDNLLFFLPDENKQQVIRDDTFLTSSERDADMENTYVVNSKVISSSIYIELLLNSSYPDYSYSLPDPIRLHFHANKTARDPVCVFLDLNNLRNLYNTSGCMPIEVNAEYVVCSCEHMTTFAVLMKIGDDGRYNEKDRTPDGMLLFACVVNFVMLILVILVYLIVEVFKKDRFFILINMWLALILAHFMIMAGGYPGTRNEHACKFVVFIIQCTALASFAWFTLMAIMIYTQLKDPVPLGRQKMVLYFLVGWLTPLLATVFTMALNYEAYGRTDEVFCWISWIDGAPMGFAIPEIIMVIAILVLLLLSERFVRSQMKDDEGSQTSVKNLIETVDYGRLQSYIYKLLAFLLILCLAWGFFALLNSITVVFFLLDVAAIVFVVLVFCILDPEVQQGFKTKRQEWRYNRIKKEKQKKEEKKPEWVRTMQSERDYMRSLEERDMYGDKSFYEADLYAPKPTVHTQPAKPKYVYTG